jgi:hypothetical protein
VPENKFDCHSQAIRDPPCANDKAETSTTKLVNNLVLSGKLGSDAMFGKEFG